jgi:hypothetical protein
MLIHIRPRLFSPFRNVELIDLKIESLGLDLRGGTDLVARRPYPNKRYAVGCRKKGLKAIDGILIETARPVDEFCCVARWAIESEFSVTHQVRYSLLDHDFDAASDDMVLWYACCSELGGWPDRRPEKSRSTPPVMTEPRMEVVENPVYGLAHQDILDPKSGYITFRRQSFAMPTLERQRVTSTALNRRMPELDAAFRSGRSYNLAL